MSNETLKDFRKRLKQIEKKNGTKGRWLAKSNKIRPDGTSPEPKTRWIPWKFLCILAVGFIGLKVFLLINLGENKYHRKLSVLDDGTIVGDVGVRLMELDPVTLKMRDVVVPIVDNIFIN